MPNWNPQQEKAIYTMDKNIVVSASAGSGKTTVLIARLLHLVKDKRIPIDQILAMTFTEAAANEMKKRLSKQLQDALQNAKDNEEKQYLNKQLVNMSKANISTIHGFCLDIIKNYYYVLGLEKEACENIMDSSMEAILLKKSMQATFHTYMQDERFVTLCQMFSTRADSNNALEEAITSLFYLANARSNPIAFLDACRIQKDVHSIKEYSDDQRHYFFDFLLVQVDSILDALNQAKLHYIDNDDVALISDKTTSLEKARSHILAQTYESFREVFFQQSTVTIKKVKDDTELDAIKKEVETLEAKLHALLFEEKTFVENTNANRPYVNLLVDLVVYFTNYYTKEKRHLKLIDFSDMEHFALQILESNQQYVASLYREQFYEIMVDEFQDSNDVQDTLVKLICKDNNVFRVGDIKQSIYGFRHATPEIMRTLIEQQTENDEVIYLSNNYRSKKSIVDFNNILFDRLMNIHGFASSFSENDYTKTGLDAQEVANTPSQIHLIHDKEINEDRFEKLSKDELKASYIANQIITMKKDKGYDYKDFVVLIKTNAKSEYLREAFEEANIPYFINMKHGFYESSAVQNVIAFLKALENPHDDIAMCALLLSPFYKWNDEALAQAKIHKEKEDSYYSYFKQMKQLDDFETLRKALSFEKLSMIITQVFYFNNYYEVHTTTQEKSNLDKLYEIITTSETKEALSLSMFLTTLEDSKNTQIGEAIPISNSDDVVRVMSIHQSKGLQFPVVFLYSVDNVSLFDTRGMVGFDDTLKVAMNHIKFPHRLVYPTLERIAFNHKVTKSALEEEMRVLYVATTRAQNEMIIVDCSEDEAYRLLNKVEIYKKNSFTSWILQAYQTSQKDLFTIQHISSLWDVCKQPQIHTTSETIKKYSLPSQSIKTISPSESEVFTFTPSSFRIDEDIAFMRGTNLHKMVEHLPNTRWNEGILTNIATMNQIELSTHDIAILLALSNNSIFIQAQHGEVHHEFPFMVNHNDEIIHGFMDYISIQDNTIILVDFKSDRNASANELIKRYRIQLETYEQALHILYPTKEVMTYIYSFELQEMIEI